MVLVQSSFLHAVDEAWRPIPGYEGRYEASSLGRVRSLRSRGKGPRDGWWDRVRPEPLVLRENPDRDGYVCVTLGPGGKQRVHHLVLAAFVGPRPPRHQGSHLNGHPADNRPENLAWETPTENNRRKIAHGTIATGERHSSRTHPERVVRGERHASAKLTEGQIVAIRAAVAGGERAEHVAGRYGVNPTTVARIIHRRNWRHVV